MTPWFLENPSNPDGPKIGPFTEAQLKSRLDSGETQPHAMAYANPGDTHGITVVNLLHSENESPSGQTHSRRHAQSESDSLPKNLGFPPRPEGIQTQDASPVFEENKMTQTDATLGLFDALQAARDKSVLSKRKNLEEFTASFALKPKSKTSQVLSAVWMPVLIILGLGVLGWTLTRLVTIGKREPTPTSQATGETVQAPKVIQPSAPTTAPTALKGPQIIISAPSQRDTQLQEEKRRLEEERRKLEEERKMLDEERRIDEGRLKNNAAPSKDSNSNDRDWQNQNDSQGDEPPVENDPS